MIFDCLTEIKIVFLLLTSCHIDSPDAKSSHSWRSSLNHVLTLDSSSKSFALSRKYSGNNCVISVVCRAVSTRKLPLIAPDNALPAIICSTVFLL